MAPSRRKVIFKALLVGAGRTLLFVAEQVFLPMEVGRCKMQIRAAQ